ncbi:hypothetical protein ATM97_25655 [Nocardia sp. MH4]|uniref:hypothetical protein n=1 Tax=Nocardia TaxID=1817 RepID=UPI001C4F2AED|nr:MULTISPECIES: hypothetical protein [Nocardia]MBW0273468.1 hypothetical protein [Nocardia sp. MH4]
MLSLYDYQLAMLNPMCDSAPVQAAELLRTLGVTRAETADAAQRYRSAPRRAFDDYLAAWGAPESLTVAAFNRNMDMRTARWNLSFWPDLHIELSSPHERSVFRHFVRRPHLPPMVPRSLDDLTPWSCTAAEFSAGGLGPIDHVDGFGGIGDVSAFAVSDPHSHEIRTYWAYFDWSLLQGVEPAPDTYVWDPCCDGSTGQPRT